MDKKTLKKEWQKREQRKLIDSMPIPAEELMALFDFLDCEDAPECDHSLRKTEHFLRSRNLSVEKVVPWLREHGGYCDCEVLFNVEDKFGPLIAG